jgi:MYXO-CTERM domain-containing protein
MRSRMLFILPTILLAAQLGRGSTDFSFTGTFTSDTDIQFFTFTLNADTPNVTIETLSYGGGVNAAGTTIPAGGFDPIISLFAADGTQMNPGQSGSCPPQTIDPATGDCGDVYYPTTLSFPAGIWPAGTYIVALTENPNSSVGNLSDGFFDSVVLGFGPDTNFTCEEGPTGFQGNPPTFPVTDPFCSEFDPLNQRDGSWALDILNVDSAEEGLGSPEPASGVAALIGLVVLCLIRRRRLIRP